MVKQFTIMNYLCKVSVDGFDVWKILCLKCRNGFSGFRLHSETDRPCDTCGATPAPLQTPPTITCQHCKRQIPLDQINKHVHEITKLTSFKVACRIDEYGNLVIP